MTKVKALLLVVIAAVFSVLLATPASAHISKCRALKPAQASSAGAGYIGGLGSFDCDPYGNHHSYIGTKVEVQVRTMNLPGEKFDQYTTVRGRVPNMSPRRENTESIKGSGYPTVAPCYGVTNTYKIKMTIAMVGVHGVREHSASSDPRQLTCKKR